MKTINRYISTLFTMVVALVLPGTLNAADSIYWGNEGAGQIRIANLDGSGIAATLFGGEGGPCGVAIDPAAGKIYWANFNSDGIRVANLDGSGTAATLFGGEGSLCGVSIDPVGGKIYWANFSNNNIRVANLDGSGIASTLFQEAGGTAPSGVVIDTVAGLIYWTNQFSDEVRVGNLDGSGTASTLVSGEDNPIGVAIDPAANKIYWAQLGACCSGPGAIRVADLNGANVSTLFGGEGAPGGLAIDPGANKVYWANFGPGIIRFGNLDGTGTAATLYSGESLPLFSALLKTPLSTTDPNISSGPGVGELTCNKGEWASDLTGAFLFRAPKDFAYQWIKDGNDIPGEMQETFTPSESGSYSCRVTASNQAGSTSETSSAVNIDDRNPCTCDAGGECGNSLENDCSSCSIVTDSSLCPLTNDMFRLIYIQDPTSLTTNNYRLNSSNPGQFYYNVFYNGTPPGDPVDLTLMIPYPFVTQGATPVHLYNGSGLSNGGCFLPDNIVSDCTINTEGGNMSPNGSEVIVIGDYDPQNLGSSTFVDVHCDEMPASGVLYVNVHFDYGLKKTTAWTKDGSNNAHHSQFASGDGEVIIHDIEDYDFFTDGDTCDASVSSENIFKKNPGVNGATLQNLTGEPIPGVKVQLFGPTGKLLKTASTDIDGVFLLSYKATGKAANYTVKLPDYKLQKTVQLKANGYAVAIFENLP